MRRLQILFPIVPFLFSACGENKSNEKVDSIISKTVFVDSSKIQKITELPPRKISEAELACFYVLNDKYAGTPKSEILSKWLETFLDSVNGKNIDSNDNLFNNGGGGPMGAQWNPNADLLFAAFFTGKLDTSSVIFKMNDFPVLKNKTGINKRKDGITVCWFLIPKNRFTVMLHLASEKEIKEICEIKKLDQNSWIKNSCTVMKISAEAKANGSQTILLNYLLASFGE